MYGLIGQGATVLRRAKQGQQRAAEMRTCSLGFLRLPLERGNIVIAENFARSILPVFIAKPKNEAFVTNGLGMRIAHLAIPMMIAAVYKKRTISAALKRPLQKLVISPLYTH